jgi:hypothetical protein
VVTQAAVVAVTIRQPSTSPRAAAAQLDRARELVEALKARALPTVVVLIGEEPYRASEIAEFLGGQRAAIPVLVLADDPVVAAMVAGRTRVGRGFQRSHLGRSASAAASELAVRLASSLSVDVEVGEP